MSNKTTAIYTGDRDFDELLQKCLRVMKTKAIDYAEDDDRLAEIRATADSVGCSMQQVLGTYMNKHYRSIFKWFRGEELQGEPIEDKLMDNIVYSLLVYKLVKELRSGGSSREISLPSTSVHEKISSTDDNRFVGNTSSAADIGVVVCDLCGREMTLGHPLDSSLTFEEWKKEVADSPFICNVCMKDPEALGRAPDHVREAVEKYLSGDMKKLIDVVKEQR